MSKHQVKLEELMVGDRVRLEVRAPSGTLATYEGVLEQVDIPGRFLRFDGFGWTPGLNVRSGRTVEITMLEQAGQPWMAEPPAGTTVRHAGSIFIRQTRTSPLPELRWSRVDASDATRWVSWQGVLNLDTEREPEVIDPRPTAPEVADAAAAARPAVQRSGLGVRASEAARRAKTTAYGAPGAAIQELADAVTLLSRDLAQVEGALAAAKQRDKDAADTVRHVAFTAANTFQAQAERLRAVGAGDSADIWEAARAVLMEQAARL